MSRGSSCDRLVAKLDALFPGGDWYIGRADNLRPVPGTPVGWICCAGWGHPHQFDPEEGWAVEVTGDTIRETLIRAVWVSR